MRQNFGELVQPSENASQNSNSMKINFDPVAFDDNQLPEAHQALIDELNDVTFQKLSLKRRYETAVEREVRATTQYETAIAQKAAYESILADLPSGDPLVEVMQYELDRATWNVSRAEASLKNVSKISQMIQAAAHDTTIDRENALSALKSTIETEASSRGVSL